MRVPQKVDDTTFNLTYYEILDINLNFFEKSQLLVLIIELPLRTSSNADEIFTNDYVSHIGISQTIAPKTSAVSMVRPDSYSTNKNYKNSGITGAETSTITAHFDSMSEKRISSEYFETHESQTTNSILESNFAKVAKENDEQANKTGDELNSKDPYLTENTSNNGDIRRTSVQPTAPFNFYEVTNDVIMLSNCLESFVLLSVVILYTESSL